MNEQNEQIDNCFDGDEVVKEFFKNKLKNVSTRVIEETIAKTICELIGEELECRISDIKYGDGFTSTYAKLDVSFTRILK